jgi:acetyl esterase/lipase
VVNAQILTVCLLVIVITLASYDGTAEVLSVTDRDEDLSSETIDIIFPEFQVSHKPIYKVVDDIELSIIIRVPQNIEGPVPVIVFFFGGGWTRGNQSHFERQAKYFSNLGLVTALVDYRVANRHGTRPADALIDAKSAVRYLRKNAKKYKINPNKMVGAGGSAGAHLAAAASVIEHFNSYEDDLKIDPSSNALILWNPVIDNGPGGYGHSRVKEYWELFSPFHNIRTEHPPTLVMLGDQDNLLSVHRAKQYIDKIKKTGAQASIEVFEGQAHGFGNGQRYVQTLLLAHTFLMNLGYIEEAPPLISDHEMHQLNKIAEASFVYE